MATNEDDRAAAIDKLRRLVYEVAETVIYLVTCSTVAIPSPEITDAQWLELYKKSWRGMRALHEKKKITTWDQIATLKVSDLRRIQGVNWSTIYDIIQWASDHGVIVEKDIR